MIRTTSIDWRQMSTEAVEELSGILKEFGVYLYEMPEELQTGDDTNLAVSDHELTKDQLNKIFEDYG